MFLLALYITTGMLLTPVFWFLSLPIEDYICNKLSKKQILLALGKGLLKSTIWPILLLIMFTIKANEIEDE